MFSPSTFRVLLRRNGAARFLHASPARRDFLAKYGDKLKEKLDKEGKSLADALAESKKRPIERLPEAQKFKAASRQDDVENRTGVSFPQMNAQRNDESPVKPLSSLMDLTKLMKKPHSAEQISALWTVYHASRSGGTGRGYLSASIPLSTYTAMMERAKSYPRFVIPLPRNAPDAPKELPEEQTRPYEFYFMEWSFHPPPPLPSATADDPFSKPLSSDLGAQSNPPVSTVLFTSLGEYKLHQTFATPQLILTHHTDLARTHGIVLLRGELTPSPSSTNDSVKYALGQQDAQLLAMAVQRMFLTTSDASEVGQQRARLLKDFHENPANFKWEDLLQYADPSVL